MKRIAWKCYNCAVIKKKEIRRKEDKSPLNGIIDFKRIGLIKLVGICFFVNIMRDK